MKIGKKLLALPFVQHGLCLLISLYIKLVYHTSRWEVQNQEVPHQLEASGKPGIFLFWHGRLFLMPHLPLDPSRISVIISQHRDGEIIARTMRYFGLKLIRGSTDKDSSHVVRQAIRVLKSGQHVAITPDGPRGPRMCINGNIAAIAAMTDATVIPVTFSASNARTLGTWDRFILPKPFGKGVIIYGDPITVPANAAKEEIIAAKTLLAAELNAITHQADSKAGITPVQPADPATPPKKRRTAP